MRYMDVPRQDLKKFNGRIPAELFDQIRALATQLDLSVNATVVALLREALKDAHAK